MNTPPTTRPPAPTRTAASPLPSTSQPAHPKFLYLTQPTSEYSPSLFSAWVLSKQHEKDLVIGDARSQPPALRRVSDEPSLLSCHRLESTNGACRASTTNAQPPCASTALSARAFSRRLVLEPRVVRVGCTSVRLAWEAPRPPFWGVGVPAPLQYRLHIEVPPLGSSPAAEIIVPAENADAGMRSGGASRKRRRTMRMRMARWRWMRRDHATRECRRPYKRHDVRDAACGGVTFLKRLCRQQRMDGLWPASSTHHEHKQRYWRMAIGY